MFDSRRQHPVAAVTRALKVVKENALQFILVLVLGQGSSFELFSFYGIVGVLLFVIVIGAVDWYRYTFRVEEGELRIEKGVLVRKKIYIPKERIQVIDTTSGVLQRMFGLVSLKIRTASGSEGATIDAITKTEAEQLAGELRSADPNGDELENRESTADEAQAVEEPLAEKRIDSKHLILAGLTSGSIGIALAIIGSVMSQAGEVLSESQLYDVVEGLFRSGTQFWLAMIAGLIFAALILSFFGTLFKYANFRLVRWQDRLLIERGLLEKREITIPLDRIQAIRVRQNPFREPFGYAELLVDSAGYGDERGASSTLFPMIRKREIPALLGQFADCRLPNVEMERPPGRAFIRYQVKLVVPVLLVSILLNWFQLNGWFVTIFLLPAALLAYYQYRDAGLAIRDDAQLLPHLQPGICHCGAKADSGCRSAPNHLSEAEGFGPPLGLLRLRPQRARFYRSGTADGGDASSAYLAHHLR